MDIHWVGVSDLDEAQRSNAEERLMALAEGHSDLIDLRITGRQTRHHVHGAKEIRITCLARGREIIAARTRAELGIALIEALDAFEREVHRLREKRQDARRARPPEPPFLGIVDKLFPDEGYGFILTDAGDQVYFHRNAVKGGLDFDRLEEASRVALNIEAGDKGPQATAVVAPPPGTP